MRITQRIEKQRTIDTNIEERIEYFDLTTQTKKKNLDTSVLRHVRGIKKFISCYTVSQLCLASVKELNF